MLHISSIYLPGSTHLEVLSCKSYILFYPTFCLPIYVEGAAKQAHIEAV